MDTKSAMERARQLKIARNLFVVMCVCSPVVLGYSYASFEPRYGNKFFNHLLAACCLLLTAAKMCCSPSDPK